MAMAMHTHSLSKPKKLRADHRHNKPNEHGTVMNIHSYLLPGIDDGPQQIEDSVAMPLAYSADGVSDVVVTTHVFPGRYENMRSSIITDYNGLGDLGALYGSASLRIDIGAEYALSARIRDQIATRMRLTEPEAGRNWLAQSC